MRAAWLGGSAAFNRLDEFSDIDVQFDVTAGMVARGFEAVEGVLSSIRFDRIQVDRSDAHLAWTRAGFLPAAGNE
jgi:hypothetical protein